MSRVISRCVSNSGRVEVRGELRTGWRACGSEGQGLVFLGSEAGGSCSGSYASSGSGRGMGDELLTSGEVLLTVEE